MSITVGRILVVEDEPIVLNAIRMMLAYDGHLVEAAADAKEALAKFAPDTFDIVITDYWMIGMKGDVLAAAIKACAPNQPIMLLTAHAGMLDMTGARLENIDLVVNKPFRLETLRTGIAQLMMRSRVRSGKGDRPDAVEL